MIESVYSVLDRINELKNRFGLKRHNQTAESGKSQSFAGRPADAGGAPVHADTSAGIRLSDNPTKENINAFSDIISAKKGIPPALTRAIIDTESEYNPNAVSPKGAKGLMQLMPSVIKDYKVDNPFNPEENINAGTSLLGDLLKTYNHDYKKAVSAYNAGRTAVDKAGGVPDYPETQNYVQRVLEKANFDIKK